MVDTSSEGPGDYQLPKVTAELVTNTITAPKPQFHLNVDGLGVEAALHIQLLDHLENPIAGHTCVIRQNGYQVPINGNPQPSYRIEFV